jgi:hypothetical protein
MITVPGNPCARHKISQLSVAPRKFSIFRSALECWHHIICRIIEEHAAMPHIRRLFQHSAMLKVLAANIRDGEKSGLHPEGHFQAIAQQIRLGLDARKGLGNADPEDYLIEFEHVCYGQLPERAGSAHLLCATPPMPVDAPDWYTCVITVSHWTKYLSTATIDQLSEAAGVALPFVPMGGSEDPALYRILTKLRRGEFVPRSDFSLGFPLVWITPRPEFEHKIRLGHDDRADAARDFLGLVHREANEHLIAIHIPSAIIELVRSARPIFSDAGRHRRFMVMPDVSPPPYRQAWGQTLDLECFETSGARTAGAAERVIARIDSRLLGGTKIQFEYLGRLQYTRGQLTATDMDFATCQEAVDRSGYAQIVQQI